MRESAEAKADSIEVCEISKEYGEKRILRGVSFRLGKGIHTLLGANGAGKSTLLGILSFQLEATGGFFRIEGSDSREAKGRRGMQGKIGVLGHRSFLSRGLTLRENLEYHCRLYGEEKSGDLLEEVGRQVGMSEKMDRYVGEFSRGQLQRASLARLLVLEPSVILLDEPTTGLDGQGTKVLREVLSGWEAKGEVSVLMTTHDLGWAAECSQGFVVLSRGQCTGETKGPLCTSEVQAFYQEASRSQDRRVKKEKESV